MLMKINMVWIILIFPYLSFAAQHNNDLSKDVMTSELYITNKVKHKVLDPNLVFVHQYTPRDEILSMFEHSKSPEIHFKHLDLNQEVHKNVSIQWLPLYDFS